MRRGDESKSVELKIAQNAPDRRTCRIKRLLVGRNRLAKEVRGQTSRQEFGQRMGLAALINPASEAKDILGQSCQVGLPAKFQCRTRAMAPSTMVVVSALTAFAGDILLAISFTARRQRRCRAFRPISTETRSVRSEDSISARAFRAAARTSSTSPWGESIRAAARLVHAAASKEARSAIAAARRMLQNRKGLAKTFHRLPRIVDRAPALQSHSPIDPGNGQTPGIKHVRLQWQRFQKRQGLVVRFHRLGQRRTFQPRQRIPAIDPACAQAIPK